MRKVFLFVKAMRPQQWAKNVFVFAPAVFSKEIVRGRVAEEAFLVFVLFSLLSSSVYIINDFFDRKEDRRHPVKRLRPIASGQLPAYPALVGALLLAGLSLAVSFWWRRPVFLVMLFYFLLNFLYSSSLKKVVILDVFVVALGFDLREAAGGLASGIYLSPWLFAVTFLLALFLATVKRRQELVKMKEVSRQTLLSYPLSFLEQFISIISAATVLSYIIYTLTPEIRHKLGEHLYLTTPFVLYGILRYLFLAHSKGMGEDPLEIILKDRTFQVNLLLWVGMVGVIIFTGW